MLESVDQGKWIKKSIADFYSFQIFSHFLLSVLILYPIISFVTTSIFRFTIFFFA